MPKFNFRVKTKEGGISSGQIEALDEEKAINKLLKEGYFIIDLTRVRSEAWKRDLIGSLGGRVSSRELSFMYLQLSTLISSGITLLESLEILVSQVTNSTLRNVLREVKDDVSGGSDLSSALARHSRVFPKLFVSMIRAGETGGMLDEVLNKLAEFSEKEQKLKGKLKAAMIYPVILLLGTIGVVSFLLIYIFPKFIKIFKKFGGELPIPTKLLITFSNFMSAHYIYLLAGIIIIAAALWSGVKFSRRGRYIMDAVKLKTPILGSIYAKGSISRLTRTLGTLLENGVNIIQALDVVKETTENQILYDILDRSKDEITGGSQLNESLKKSKYFPVMVTKMVEVGEKTGQLPSLLLRISDFYEYEAEIAIDSMMSMIEPLLIVIMGAGVGFVALAMLMPLFDLTKFIK